VRLDFVRDLTDRGRISRLNPARVRNPTAATRRFDFIGQIFPSQNFDHRGAIRTSAVRYFVRPPRRSLVLSLVFSGLRFAEDTIQVGVSRFATRRLVAVLKT
jgi:hypothetical protein